MELIERVTEAVCEAMYGKQFDAHQMPEAYGHADRIAKAAIRAMLDGVEPCAWVYRYPNGHRYVAIEREPLAQRSINTTETPLYSLDALKEAL